MNFETFFFKYKTEKLGDKYIVRVKCWLWGVSDRYLNRFGELERQLNSTCKYDDEEIARKRLVKYLKDLNLY